jgi:hypothetical protein
MCVAEATELRLQLDKARERARRPCAEEVNAGEEQQHDGGAAAAKTTTSHDRRRRSRRDSDQQEVGAGGRKSPQRRPKRSRTKPRKFWEACPGRNGSDARQHRPPSHASSATTQLQEVDEHWLSRAEDLDEFWRTREGGEGAWSGTQPSAATASSHGALRGSAVAPGTSQRATTAPVGGGAAAKALVARRSPRMPQATTEHDKVQELRQLAVQRGHDEMEYELARDLLRNGRWDVQGALDVVAPIGCAARGTGGDGGSGSGSGSGSSDDGAAAGNDDSGDEDYHHTDDGAASSFCDTAAATTACATTDSRRPDEQVVAADDTDPSWYRDVHVDVDAEVTTAAAATTIEDAAGVMRRSGRERSRRRPDQRSPIPPRAAVRESEEELRTVRCPYPGEANAVWWCATCGCHETLRDKRALSPFFSKVCALVGFVVVGNGVAVVR